jgi:guanylate kinase
MPLLGCVLQALRSNPRIDGLYLYISTSSPEVLAQRQKQRLAEATSTLSKRLAWAKQQVAKSATAGLFDNIIQNTSLAEVSVGCAKVQSRCSMDNFPGQPSTWPFGLSWLTKCPC